MIVYNEPSRDVRPNEAINNEQPIPMYASEIRMKLTCVLATWQAYSKASS